MVVLQGSVKRAMESRGEEELRARLLGGWAAQGSSNLKDEQCQPGRGRTQGRELRAAFTPGADDSAHGVHG